MASHRVRVRTLRKKEMVVELASSATVVHLKSKVASALGQSMESNSVRLFYKGKILQDGDSILNLGLSSTDSGFVLAYLRPAVKKSKSNSKPKRNQATVKESTVEVKVVEEKEQKSNRKSNDPVVSTGLITSATTQVGKGNTAREKELDELMRLIGLELKATDTNSQSNPLIKGDVRVLRPMSTMFESKAAQGYLKEPRIQAWIAQGLKSKDAALSSGSANLLHSCLKSHKNAAKTLMDVLQVWKAIVGASCDFDIQKSAAAGNLIIGMAESCEGVAARFYAEKAVFEATRPETFAEVRFRLLDLSAKLSAKTIDGDWNTCIFFKGPEEYLKSNLFKSTVSIIMRGPGLDPLLWGNALEVLAEAMRTEPGFRRVLFHKRLFHSLLLDDQKRVTPKLSASDALTLVHHLALGARRSKVLEWIAPVTPQGGKGEEALLEVTIDLCKRGLESEEDTTRAMAGHGVCLLATCSVDLLLSDSTLTNPSGADEKVVDDGKNPSRQQSNSRSHLHNRLRSALMDVADNAGEGSSGQAKVASLVGLANVIGNAYEIPREYKKNDTPPLADLRESLVTRLGMRTVKRLIHSPFQDVSTAAYTLLRNVATWGWGLEAIATQGGLVETLLDRDNGAGTSPMAHQWRFATLEALSSTISQHKAASHFIDTTTQERIRNFVREGPFYSKILPQVKVATATR